MVVATVRFVLVMEAGPTPGKVYPLPSEVITLGRETDNTLPIDSPKISRHHAQLKLSPSGVVILEDLKSLNGTFIEGQPVTEPCQIFPNETFMLADAIRFRLVDTEPAPQWQPPAAAPQPVGKPGVSGGPPAPSSVIDSPKPVKPRESPKAMPDPAPRWMVMLAACLGALTCVCGALAIYLWFAPPTFWQRLLALIGFQLP